MQTFIRPMFRGDSEDFNRALELSKRILRVSPKAFEHYVREGRKKDIPFEFYSLHWPFVNRRPFVEVIHALFSASNYSDRIKGLKVMEDFTEIYRKEQVEKIFGGDKFDAIYGQHRVDFRSKDKSPWDTLRILIHEYVHALEAPLYKKESEGLEDVTYFWLRDDVFIDIFEKPLPSKYWKLLYSFVTNEQSSNRVELAFANPELLIAFYNIMGLKEDPFKLIEETMGWENIFSRDLKKLKIRKYEDEIGETLDYIKRSRLAWYVIGKEPELWEIITFNPSTWPREGLLVKDLHHHSI